MADVSKGISSSSASSSASQNRYNSMNLGESIHISSQVQSHVEPCELVELFYENHSVPNQVNHTSPTPPHSPPQVIEDSQKSKLSSNTYKCEICSRSFKEASHFSKHKRGALCRKSAQKLAKKNKKNLKHKESCEKKNKPMTNLYKPFQCTLCGAKFFDKVNVELHLERTHQTRQPLWLQTSKTGGVACIECDLWFVDKLQLRQHQHQQHSNNQMLQPTPQNEPPPVQPPLTQQPMPPPPPPPPQYYFQPLQHIQTFSSNQIHQLGPPPPQGIQQMPPQMGPPQGQSMPTYVVPHPQNTQAVPAMPDIPHQQHVPNSLGIHQVPLSTTNHIPTSSIIPVEASNPIKASKVSYSNNWTNSRRNVCGECGMKFVDPINLELHMQRKHPNSSVVETVGLEGGITLYKTNNSNNVESIPEDISLKPTNIQTFDCALCGLKTNSMGNIVKHLQNSHNTSNANFINVSILNNLEGKKNKQSKLLKKTDLNRNCEGEKFKCKCESCSKEFESQDDLIRHTIKEKNILCGICNFNSCSDAKVASHMYSTHGQGTPTCSLKNYVSQPNNLHSNSDQSCDPSESISNEKYVLSRVTESYSPETSINKDEDSFSPRLSCCMCDFFALSGVSLAQHLESHGSIHVKCGRCDEYREHFLDIHNHISSAHAGEVTRVSITMKASESPSVYMFMITPTSNYLNVTNEDHDTSKDSSSPGKSPDNTLRDNEMANLTFPDNEDIYACSDCMTCLIGDIQLEAHITSHQSFNSKLNRISGTDSQSMSTLPQSSFFNSSSVTPLKLNPLQHTQNTIEFRCKECGLWRVTSDPVIRHIQAVHMSGVVVHSLRQKSGPMKYINIHVFTPLSPLVLN